MFIEIEDINSPDLDFYARYTEQQLRTVEDPTSVDSLNVAAASAISFWELMKRKDA